MSISFFQTVTDFDHLCQGDILHNPRGQEPHGLYGIVITADCDLAQKKTFGDLNFVELLPVDEYYRKIWPSREAHHLFREIERDLTKQLSQHKVIKSKNITVSFPEIANWLNIEGSNQVCIDLGDSNETNKLRPLLTSLEVINKNEEITKGLIFNLWDRLQKSEAYRRDRIGRAIDPNKGQSDVFFLPYLPKNAEVGYIALLRRIGKIDQNLVFNNYQDYRRSDIDCGFYRLARLTDNLRFSLVQKISLLFSRIGSEESVEDEIREASSITINSILDEGKIVV